MSTVLTNSEALATYRAMMTMAPHGASIQFPGHRERHTTAHVVWALDGVFVRSHGPDGLFEHYDTFDAFAAAHRLALSDALSPQAFA